MRMRLIFLMNIHKTIAWVGLVSSDESRADCRLCREEVAIRRSQSIQDRSRKTPINTRLVVQVSFSAAILRTGAIFRDSSEIKRMHMTVCTRQSFLPPGDEAM